MYKFVTQTMLKGRFFRSYGKTWIPLLVTGLLLWGTSLFCYFRFGFSSIIAYSVLLSVGLVGLFFWGVSVDKKLPRLFDPRDLYVVVGLILFFIPIYLWSIHSIPFQVNTDEIVIGVAARTFSSAENLDLFAPSSYFHFPAFIFILFGKLTKVMGGITFLNLRIVHAIFGILITVPCYFFFRLVFDKFYATGATVLVLGQHALLAISRMVSRNNIAVLNETAAFLLLIIGFQKKSPFYSFFGGVVAGISFYHYPPSQIIFPLWLFSLCCVVAFDSTRYDWRTIAISVGASIVGFCMVVAPTGVAFLKTSDNSSNYGRQQILLFNEGRILQQHWYFLGSQLAGVQRNIVQGFTMFNSPIVDQAYIYPNYGHGFLDVLSGIFLWVGFLVVLSRCCWLRGKGQATYIIMFSGFISLWIIYMFILGQAPNYTRLFLVIPFISFFVIMGVRSFIATLVGLIETYWWPVRPLYSYVACAFLIGCIFIANMGIFADFVAKGFLEGNDVGGTGRYIESKKSVVGYRFYIAADASYPYYSFGDASAWQSWAQFFAGENQSVAIVAPNTLEYTTWERPFTVFTSSAVWDQYGQHFSSRYPQFLLHTIKNDASLIAVEVE